MQDQIFIKYNFITKDEIKKLLHFFYKSKIKRQYRDTFLIDLENNFLDIKNKFNKFNNKFEIDWWYVVQWPTGSYQAFHKDTHYDKTKLTSITYLNDDFKGGETLFSDGTKITPYPGKTVFFDGQYFEHSVSTILKNTRYALSCWYKDKYE